MATEIKDIVDRDSFSTWLETQSAETAQILAMRIALRALPITLSVQGLQSEKLTQKIKDNLILSSFRAGFISWAAGKYPAHDISSAATKVFSDVVTKASATGVIAATPPFNAAFAAAYAVNAVIAAAGAVIAAAGTAKAAARTAVETDVWELIRKDAEFLTSATLAKLTTSPLWLDDVRGDERYRVNMPQGIRKCVDQFKKSEEFEANHWHLWLDWYTNLLTNPPTSRFGEKIDLEIALKPKEFWDRDATEVMAELAEIVGSIQAKPFKESVFVSYSKDDEPHARWIVDCLERAGIPTFAQFKDIPSGANFVREMQFGLDACNRLIAVVSPSYENSDHCQAEWSSFYNEDPSGSKRRLLPVLAKPTSQNALAKQIVYTSILGMTHQDAAKALLKTVGADSNIELPDSWPGGTDYSESRGAGAKLYELEMGPNQKLRQKVPIPTSDAIAEFTPEQHYDEICQQAAELADRLKQQSGNQYYSQTLQDRADGWNAALKAEFKECNPLVLNKAIIWLLRAFAADVANGNLAGTDVIRLYAVDLQAYYNRLEYIFPKLAAYRKLDARDRFELPTAEEDGAFEIVLKFFGDRESSGDLLSDYLVDQFEQVRADRADAHSLDEKEGGNQAGATKLKEATNEVIVEAETDAANRTLEMWSWIANARGRMEKAGKSAEEIADNVAKFEKAYSKLSPHMEKVLEYLTRWFF